MPERASIPRVTKLLLTRDAARFPQILATLAETARQSAESRAEQQLAQLDALVRIALEHTPYYSARLSLTGRLDWDAFRRIPILSKNDLQDHAAELVTTRQPPAHAPTGSVSSSGSTGTPVVTRGTWASGALNRALQLRFQRWHGFDFDGTTAFLVAPERERAGANWSTPLGRGKSVHLDLLADPDAQLDALIRIAPRYVATFPSNLTALLERARARGIGLPGLEAVVLSSEPVPEHLPQECRTTWNTSCLATYSASEVGAIAFEVPGEGRLAVQSENLFVEILDDDGTPTPPGAVGRVVVTTLQDFLRPLIRYEIGDYATALEPAPSSSAVQLPRLARVLGRERTMVRLPDGRRVWPHFDFGSVVGRRWLRRWQLVQKRDGAIEVRVVPLESFDDDARMALTEVVQRALPGVTTRLVLVDAIERTARGKYLEFLSELD